MTLNKDTLKGAAVGLVLAAVVLGALWLRGAQRAVNANFAAIDAYLGACQETGVLPTVEALKARIAALQKAQDAPKNGAGK